MTAYHLNETLMDLCAKGTQRIMSEGFTPSRGGDISLRDPATNLIYISAGPADMPFPCSNFSEVESPDPAVFTLEGERLCGDKLATCELPMHLAIFRARPEVTCVLHIHALWSTMFAMVGKGIPEFSSRRHTGKILESEIIKTAAYAPAGALEVGDYVVKALGNKNAAMLASHGAVAVGVSMEMAFANARILEATSHKYIYELLLNRRNEHHELHN